MNITGTKLLKWSFYVPERGDKKKEKKKAHNSGLINV